jgi:hypothetical protein
MHQLQSAPHCVSENVHSFSIGYTRTLTVWDGFRDALASCREKGYDISLRWFVSEPERLSGMLQDGNMDAVDTFADPILIHCRDYDSFVIDNSESVMFIAKGHPLLGGDDGVQRVLDELPVAHWCDPAIPASRVNDDFHKNWKKEGVIVKDEMFFPNADTAVIGAEMGDCVIFAAARWQALNPRLEAVSLNKTFDYLFIWKKNRRNDVFNVFVDEVRALASSRLKR